MSTYPSKDIERAASAANGADAADGRAAAPGPEDGACRAAPRALVRAVEPGSPADDAGFEPGCYVTAVDGRPVRDVIDWRWLTADDVIEVGYIDLDGDAGEVELERDEGQGWGFEFEGVVFDGVRQCRNACTFCFMRQLPDGMRPSLTLRDDDFRLSFLAGTFVTFTNLAPADEARIVEQSISPLRLSLHASNPDVRRRMIGRHAQHGIDVLERLLAAGIEFHAQIVLVPGQNDGEALAETLEWAYARPGILDVCIVPLGFTKHQSAFDRSFNDPASSQAVMDLVAPFQRRALDARGTLWAFPADEFYACAYGDALLDNLPPAAHYGDFGMFEDGVGIIRSFVDDWELAEREGLVARCAEALRAAGTRVRFVAGCAMRRFLDPLVARGPLAGLFEPLYVENRFFGGNVDVTGLLCGCDIVRAVRACEAGPVAPQAPGGALYAVPRIVLNDDAVTLDDMTLEDMQSAAGARVAVVSCNASGFLREAADLAGLSMPAQEEPTNL